MAIPLFLPLIIDALKKGNNILVKHRMKSISWAIGIFILLLFPAFWKIPQQIYVRTHQQDTLITPNAPKVEDFANEFLELKPNFYNFSFERKAQIACNFTTNQIKWQVDYKTYGIAGHQATPTECITRRTDDCQGQAVTLASLLLYLGFKYVWVVETPFHWYVLVRDPSKGKLQEGWETEVEILQENGELLPLNRDGEGEMPKWRWEEILLIFNDKQTLYPVNTLEALYISWTATAFFYDDIFPMFLTYEIFLIYLGMIFLSIPIAFWSFYNACTSKESFTRNLKKIGIQNIFLRIILIGSLIFSVFYFWFLIQEILWDYTLILAIIEIGLIFLIAAQKKFWRQFPFGKNK